MIRRAMARFLFAMLIALSATVAGKLAHDGMVNFEAAALLVAAIGLFTAFGGDE